ncbi:hypothetical protein Q8A67_019223 [Cirrhinus molitorella]|uniref:Uncharacterized protein n=1 Tax=Cirrhinus molitorella TaxID=172907 RepID=A0AA88PDG2_9TELE|nr:hypothetical protein Q8A67_019223 [Cirrhinus molitorella]
MRALQKYGEKELAAVACGVSVSYPMAMAFVALTSLISFIYLLFSEDLLQAFTALRLAAGDQHRQVTTAGAVPSLLRHTPSPPPAAPRAVIYIMQPVQVSSPQHLLSQ